MTDIFTCFTSGTVACVDGCTDAAALPWNEHPTCAGVRLKHLVRGSETGGRFSAHLVQLDAGAEIDEHVHAASWELHEVVAGGGSCCVDGRDIVYTQGVAAVLPENVAHHVTAGEKGLCLLAKFVPALL